MWIVRKQLRYVVLFLVPKFPFEFRFPSDHAPENFSEHIDIEIGLNVLKPRSHASPRGRRDEIARSHGLALVPSYPWWTVGHVDQSKVAKNKLVLVPNEDVCRLDVPVDNVLLVYWWAKIVEKIAPNIEPSLQAKLLVNAMLGDNYHLRDAADNLLSALAKTEPEAVMDGLGEVMLNKDKQWLFHVQKFAVFLCLPHDVIIRWLDEKGSEGALRLARHVPAPFLIEGKPSLHPLTEYLLDKFESDDHVFREFAAGVHSLQGYFGDIAAQKEGEAEVARKFLSHRLRRVRQWAEFEIESAMQNAAMFRGLDDKERN
jgi:hypothetical protein